VRAVHRKPAIVGRGASTPSRLLEATHEEYHGNAIFGRDLAGDIPELGSCFADASLLSVMLGLRPTFVRRLRAASIPARGRLHDQLLLHLGKDCITWKKNL